MCTDLNPVLTAAREALARRLRRLVASLIAQVKLVSAEMGLVLVLLRLVVRYVPIPNAELLLAGVSVG